jgi:hypothetical protein
VDAAMDANTIDPESSTCSIPFSSSWLFRMKLEIEIGTHSLDGE